MCDFKITVKIPQPPTSPAVTQEQPANHQLHDDAALNTLRVLLTVKCWLSTHDITNRMQMSMTSSCQVTPSTQTSKCLISSVLVSAAVICHADGAA